ncbi:MAG: RICIN domain-containing protein [Thermoguttaceae bacterium]|nr:RICIN domain-containing protein [Thermoguttaceae bacterium]MDW8038368.1 RICIN domain-containing protein [Thermoguttaceae bacterium]
MRLWWVVGCAIVGFGGFGAGSALPLGAEEVNSPPEENMPLRKVPPSLQELQKAEKLLEEAFGKDIAKAKSAADRQKLAQEILKAAREEQDPAVRFAALQAARRLAVEALDGKLGLEIVREIVGAYEPLEKMSSKERLAEADRLWQQADRAQGRQKLAKQLEAVQQWLYCGITTGLVVRKWQTRIAEIGFDPAVDKFLQKFHGLAVAIVNQKTELTINVEGGTQQVGRRLIQWPDPATNPNAVWRIEVAGPGTCRFHNIETGLWLGIWNGRPTQVHYDEQNIMWNIADLQKDTFLLIHSQTGVCIKPENEAGGKGTPIIACSPDADNPACRWRFYVVPNFNRQFPAKKPN